VTDERSPQPNPRTRWIAAALYICGALLGGYGILEFGVFASIYNVMQYEPTNPQPIHLGSIRYAATALWPLPAGAFLCLAGFAYRHDRPWRWLPLVLAVLWAAAYPLVKPPVVYYYWLWPDQPH
jgi:hypothetical protein